MAAKDDLGRYGEDLAARLLVADGWSVLARNWRGTRGEVDIIARDGAEVVFVEVKTRTSDLFGGPLAAVTAPKVRRLRRLAGEWLAGQPQWWEGVRIDVVGVTVGGTAAPAVEHLRGVG